MMTTFIVAGNLLVKRLQTSLYQLAPLHGFGSHWWPCYVWTSSKFVNTHTFTLEAQKHITYATSTHSVNETCRRHATLQTSTHCRLFRGSGAWIENPNRQPFGVLSAILQVAPFRYTAPIRVYLFNNAWKWTGIELAMTYPKSISLCNIYLPCHHVVVVHKEARIENKIPLFKQLSEPPLFKKVSF